MATKTHEEIEKLKASWLNDPCWDIEDSEGFEVHKEELLAYRLEVQAEREQIRKERDAKRAEKVKAETGITDPVTAQAIWTFEEIELALERVDREMEIDQPQLQTARATLLLAAQVKRVADALESMAAQGSLEESARIWGSGRD